MPEWSSTREGARIPVDFESIPIGIVIIRGPTDVVINHCYWDARIHEGAIGKCERTLIRNLESDVIESGPLTGRFWCISSFNYPANSKIYTLSLHDALLL